MHALWRDIRYGLHRLASKPGLTIIAASAIALGVGAPTTIFSIIDALLLHPFSFRDADRIVVVRETLPQAGVNNDLVAAANFFDLRAETSAFEAAGASTTWSANLAEGDSPVRLYGAQVSPQFFSALGARAALGRTFLPEEEKSVNSSAVILSDALWRRRFGGQASVLGRVIQLNDRGYTVVGVMPPDFAYPRGGTELWTPFVSDGEAAQGRAWRHLNVVARLKPGASIDKAQSELDVIASRLAQQHPKANAGRGLRVLSLRDEETAAPRPYLLLGLGAVSFVLLIACANVANLLLLRTTEREREMAIRTALGASRARVISGLLVEYLLLALCGGGLGLLLSWLAVNLIRAGMPSHLTRLVSGWENLGVGWRVFFFTLLLSLASGLIFGTLPALYTSRVNLSEALKQSGRNATAGRGRSRTRDLLIVAEIALSLVLLVGAGLMIRSFIKSVNADLGFKPERVLTVQVDLPFQTYGESRRRADFYAGLLAQVRTLPGVVGAGAVSNVPLDFGQGYRGFAVEGKEKPASGYEPSAYTNVVTPGYFGVMGIPLIQGRDFTEGDAPESPPAVIISHSLALRHFHDENPLGRRLLLANEKQPREIVGVVGDVRHDASDAGPEGRPEPAVYSPHAQSAWHMMTVVVRSASDDPQALAPAIQAEVRRLEKDLPIFNVRPMTDVISNALAAQRLSSIMFTGFALGALLLAAVGLYAAVSYSVAQRTYEIGIRMALGARPSDIFGLVFKKGLALTLAGVGIGLVVAFAITRLMASLLYGVSATDPLVFVGVPLFLAFVTLAACLAPARRATRVDPLVALRDE